MPNDEYRVEIERRGEADDGRPRFACYVHILPMPQNCTGGTCGYSVPAYSLDGVRWKVRSLLDDIEDGQWNWPDKPRPAPENVELDDETGRFTMADFFDRGTLTAFMSAEADA